jgi:hypothetical protein
MDGANSNMEDVSISDSIKEDVPTPLKHNKYIFDIPIPFCHYPYPSKSLTNHVGICCGAHM